MPQPPRRTSATMIDEYVALAPSPVLRHRTSPVILSRAASVPSSPPGEQTTWSPSTSGDSLYPHPDISLPLRSFVRLFCQTSLPAGGFAGRRGRPASRGRRGGRRPRSACSGAAAPLVQEVFEWLDVLDRRPPLLLAGGRVQGENESRRDVAGGPEAVNDVADDGDAGVADAGVVERPEELGGPPAGNDLISPVSVETASRLRPRHWGQSAAGARPAATTGRRQQDSDAGVHGTSGAGRAYWRGRRLPLKVSIGGPPFPGEPGASATGVLEFTNSGR